MTDLCLQRGPVQADRLVACTVGQPQLGVIRNELNIGLLQCFHVEIAEIIATVAAVMPLGSIQSLLSRLVSFEQCG
jgi:hypothetical protein